MNGYHVPTYEPSPHNRHPGGDRHKRQLSHRKRRRRWARGLTETAKDWRRG